MNAISTLISDEELAAMLGCGRSTLWRLVSAGKAPTPVHLGGLTRWRRAEIEDWILSGCPPARQWRWETTRPRSRG
ncbi:MAG: helix-turn-helix domain-containing protein [Planctomycetota bacterium]